MPTINFKGKTAVENYHHTIPHCSFEFDEKLSVLSKGAKPTVEGNLIVEGDNLIALKALLPTHAGRVKCVYIDPPYNTGNEGWVYNDNLTQPQFREWIGKTVGKEGEDASRHDKWCCMMYPRLQLLKELLRDDGVIFISIDDNELHRLRVLMDEIFGEDNFLATILWKTRYSPPNDHQGIATMHDYVVAYRKTDQFKRELLPRTEKSEGNYGNPDKDPRGDWISVGYIGNKSRDERPNSWFPIIRPKDKKEMWPDENAVWRFSPETHEQNVKENRLYWGPNGEYDKPRFKRFRFEVKEGIVPGTWWEQEDSGHNEEAKKELSEILGEGLFQNPKPRKLIERLLTISVEPGDIVLDSFAGSGTTGHAVLTFNKRTDKNLRFILIQMPFESEKEKAVNICKQITSERVRKVISGYKFKGKKSEILKEYPISLRTLGKMSESLKEVEAVKEKLAAKFDSFKLSIEGSALVLTGIKEINDKCDGVPGEFTYARLGSPLVTASRTFPTKRPDYETLANYIFYTETNRSLDKAGVNSKSGKIGEASGVSYYLLYDSAGKSETPLTIEWLDGLVKSERNKKLVIYCEKLWFHRDDREAFEKRTGKSVRVMQLPFHLK